MTTLAQRVRQLRRETERHKAREAETATPAAPRMARRRPGAGLLDYTGREVSHAGALIRERVAGLDYFQDGNPPNVWIWDVWIDGRIHGSAQRLAEAKRGAEQAAREAKRSADRRKKSRAARPARARTRKAKP